MVLHASIYMVSKCYSSCAIATTPFVLSPTVLTCSSTRCASCKTAGGAEHSGLLLWMSSAHSPPKPVIINHMWLLIRWSRLVCVTVLKCGMTWCDQLQIANCPAGRAQLYTCVSAGGLLISWCARQLLTCIPGLLVSLPSHQSICWSYIDNPAVNQLIHLVTWVSTVFGA